MNIVAYTDSTAGKNMATRFGAGKRTKHVELRFVYVQNLIQAGLLQLRKIHMSSNPADVFTKYNSCEVGLVRNVFRL